MKKSAPMNPALRVVRVAQRLSRMGAMPLARSIAEKYGLGTPSAMLSTERFALVVKARHEFWALLRDSTGMSYPQLARLLEVDHSTLIYACHKRQAELDAMYPAVTLVCDNERPSTAKLKTGKRKSKASLRLVGNGRKTG